MSRFPNINALFVLVFVSVSPTWAQFTASYVEVDTLIDNGWRKNNAAIAERLDRLTDAELASVWSLDQ